MVMWVLTCGSSSGSGHSSEYALLPLPPRARRRGGVAGGVGGGGVGRVTGGGGGAGFRGGAGTVNH